MVLWQNIFAEKKIRRNKMTKKIYTQEKEVNLFNESAPYYDSMDSVSALRKDDIPFFLNYANLCGGDILELASGTGRVSIPLAKAGHRVYGIDYSDAMLNIFRRKKREMDTEISARIHIRKADMASFSLSRKFPLIIVPFRSFQTLTNEADIISSLRAVYKHLEEEGRFIIDVFKPFGNLTEENWVNTSESTTLVVYDEENDRRIRLADTRERIDTDRQVIYPKLIYYITEADGRHLRIVEPLALRYYYEEEMRMLLRREGFAIESEYGYYDGRSISEGPEMLFVCKKASKRKSI